MVSNGEKLLKTFENLAINVGNLRVNVIDGWFDTDNKELIDFLEFITNNITCENVLTPSELEAHQILSKDENILYGREYEKAVKDVSSEYKGIFDLDNNLSDLAVLEDRIGCLMEQKNHFQDLTCETEENLKEIKKALSQTQNKTLQSKINLEKANDTCLELAKKVDELNVTLFEQFKTYESFEISLYDHDISFSEHTYNINDSSLTFVHEQGEDLQRTMYNDGNFNDINERLFKSTDLIKNKEMLLRKLKAKNQFYSNLDSMALIAFTGNTSSEKLKLENNIAWKQEIYNIHMLEFNNKLTKMVNKYIDQHALLLAQEKLTSAKENLTFNQNLQSHISKISSCFFLLYVFVFSNRSNIEIFSENVLSIYNYVNNDVQRCISRTESMSSNIQQQNDYNNLPFEKRNVFMGCLINFLSNINGSEMNLKSTCNYIGQLMKDYSDVKRKLFMHKPEVYGRMLSELDLNTKVLKSFLTNGPTSEFVSIKYRLYNTFKEVDSYFLAQNSSMHAVIESFRKTTKQIAEDERLKNKRLLWMYFLFEPKKMLRIIENTEEEVRNRRKEVTK